MSAWAEERGGPLNGVDIGSLIYFIRSWQTRPALSLDESPARGDAAKGRVAFEKHCARCHGAKGPQVRISAVLISTVGDQAHGGRLGVVLYLFVVGLELDLHGLRSRAGSATVISMAGIAVPLLLGSIVAEPLHAHLGPTQVLTFVFGAYITITATGPPHGRLDRQFPVLLGSGQSGCGSASALGNSATREAAARRWAAA